MPAPSRRDCFTAGAVLAFSTRSAFAASHYYVYFGTYTGPKSKGIYVSRFDASNGQLSPPELAGEIVQPSWLTIHPNRQHLYAVSELGNDGLVTGFDIDRSSGMLKQRNKVSTGGRMACHLAIHARAGILYTANYGDGSVSAHKLLANGDIGDRTALVKHTGSGPDQRRQRGPHAHAVVLSKDARYLVVPDLGTDQYVVYKTAPDGSLTPTTPAQVKGGLGPRHFAFSPNGRLGYGLNEMGSLVNVFRFNDGKLTELASASTLAPDFTAENNCAEIEVDNEGKHVYASGRGADTITVFNLDSSGALRAAQREPTGGKTPRSFRLDPTGRWLLAANQNSDSVVVFSRDEKTGKLTRTGTTLNVPSPVCIQFLRL